MSWKGLVNVTFPSHLQTLMALFPKSKVLKGQVLRSAIPYVLSCMYIYFGKKQIGDCQTHLERRFTIDRVVSWAVVHDAEVVVGVPPGRTLRRLTYPELVDGGGGQVSRHHLYVLVTVQATLYGGKGNGVLCLFKV